MKHDGIEINEEFGVNPTMSMCFFCGEEKGELVLFGAEGFKKLNEKTGIYESAQAPMKMVVDATPCQKCQEKWSIGITFLEMTEIEVISEMKRGKPTKFEKQMVPTGRLSVITEEAAIHMLSKSEEKDEVLKRRIALMTVEDYEKIFGNVESDSEKSSDIHDSDD